MDRFEELLGVPWLPGKYGSGSWSAEKLFFKVARWEEYPPTTGVPEFGYEPIELMHSYGNPKLLDKKYVMALDVNSHYLSTFSQPFGTGNPELTTTTEFNSKRQGYWRTNITHENTPIVNGRTEWWTTSTVQFLISNGYEIKISHAVLYPYTQYPLRKWQEVVREALKQTERGDETNIRIKRMIHSFPGLMVSEKTRNRWIRRPNWNHQIVGLARSNMTRALLKCDVWPAVIMNDGAYFAVDSPDDIPKGLVISEQIGKWKVKAVVETNNLSGSAFESPVKLEKGVAHAQRESKSITPSSIAS